MGRNRPDVGARMAPFPPAMPPTLPPDLPSPTDASIAPACAPSPLALRRQRARLAGLPAAPWLHREVAARLAAKLEPIRLEPKSWIDWSAFLGDGADLVAARYPQARRWVVEPDAALAARSLEARAASQSGGWLARLTRGRPQVFTEPVPVASAPWFPDGAQMLWANMTLHGAADLPTMMGAWHKHLAVGGFLMCSGLGPDTARELRALYREAGWPLPTVDFIDMHDLGDELVRAGFADPVMDMERITLTWATPQAMLDELRSWGGNVAQGRFSGLRTRAWRQGLLDLIARQLTRQDGRIGLTVEVVYGHAMKPEPRLALAPETRVSLDDMRRMVRKKGHP